jgi:hypothetical protein
MNTILLDGLMISLLAMAIIFCWRLNGRLNNMRKMGHELKPFMKGLGSYIDQIGSYLTQLKDISETGHKSLGQQIPQAARLRDEFDLFLEQGERLAVRLEEVMTRAHQIEKQMQETLHRAKHNSARTNPTSGEEITSHTFSTRDYAYNREQLFDETHQKTTPYLSTNTENFDENTEYGYDRSPYINKKLKGLR